MRAVIAIGMVLGCVQGMGCEYQRIDANDRDALRQRPLAEAPLLDDVRAEEEDPRGAQRPGFAKEAADEPVLEEEKPEKIEGEEQEGRVGCTVAQEEDISRMKQEITERIAGIRELGGSVPEPARRHDVPITCEDDIEALESQLASLLTAYAKAKELVSSQDQARAEELPVAARRVDEDEERAECTAEQTVEITRIKQDVMNLREWILARGGSVQEPEPANDGPQTCEDDIQFLKEWAFSLRRQLIQEQGVVVPANEAEARPVPAASLSAVWHDAGVVGNYSRGIRNDTDLRGAAPNLDWQAHSSTRWVP